MNAPLSPSQTRPVPRRGLSRTEAALYLAISPSKFDELVKDRRVKRPRLIDTKQVWDIFELDMDHQEMIESSRTEAVASLYRHFDRDGRLLYIGISLNAIARLAEHRDTSHWFSQIARVEIEPYPTRKAALAAELEAIRTENPLYNIVGRVAA